MHTAGSNISDGEVLYRYAKPSAFPEGQKEIPTGIFNDPELSCDWEKYQKSPEESYHIGEGRSLVFAITVHDSIRNPRNPKGKGEIVKDWCQEIVYNPVTDEDDPNHGANPSHSLIRGKKRQAVLVALQANTVLYTKVEI